MRFLDGEALLAEFIFFFLTQNRWLHLELTEFLPFVIERQSVFLMPTLLLGERAIPGVSVFEVSLPLQRSGKDNDDNAVKLYVHSRYFSIEMDLA